jgi:DNA (cytosine-5)-methyltransferase 3A
VKMKKEWVDVISRELWVEPIEINSKLVSAQNRERLYRTNIPNVSQPVDREIKLIDIIEKQQSELITYVNGEIRIKQATKQWYIVAEVGDGVDLSFPTSNTRRGRVIKWKSNTLTTWWELYVCDTVIRKLTPIERERLQTLKDWFTAGVSDSQRYKLLGNWWTVDVIAHIFSFMK